MPEIAIILPASNEAGTIGACLDALLASEGVDAARLVVVANGCHDETATVARAHEAAFAAKGWAAEVIERAEGGKLAALDAGDSRIAPGAIRVYLDADVIVAPDLIAALARALDTAPARYASGRLEIVASDGLASRAYARFWRRQPFMADDVPGCGLFAVNAAGRARWGAFPDIISDDTFVRLHFAPEERIAVAPAYRWPVVSGLANLIRVRRRQDRGVAEIARRFPELMANAAPAGTGRAGLGRRVLADPVGFAVYGGVALAVRLWPGPAPGRASDRWARGR